MIRGRAAVLGAALAGLVLTACGGEGEGAPSAATTHEVPYDPGSLTDVERAALGDPAVVPYVDDERLAGLRVTPVSVRLGSLDDFDAVSDDRADEATLAAARVYYVRFRIEYVDGVAAGFVAPRFGLAAGETDVDDLFPEVTGGPCTLPEQDRAFGRGSRLDGCVPLFASAAAPEPDTLTWSASLEGVVETVARWPLD